MFQPEQLMQSKEESGSFANRQYNPTKHLLRLLLLDFVAFTGSDTTCLVHVSPTPDVVARGTAVLALTYDPALAAVCVAHAGSVVQQQSSQP